MKCSCLKLISWTVLLLIISSCSSNPPPVVVNEDSPPTQESVAASLRFTQQPGGGPSGSTWSQQPILEILNSSGERVTSGPDAWAKISLAIKSGTGSLTGTIYAYAILGLVTFSDLAISTDGDKVLTASKADLATYGGSSALVVDSEIFNISGLPGSKLNISGATTINPGTCSAYHINLTDSYSNSVNAGKNYTLNLFGKGLGYFYSDSLCASPITSATLTMNTASKTVYYKNFYGEPIKFFVTDTSGELTSASLEISVLHPLLKDLAVAHESKPSFCFLYTNGTAYCSGGTNGQAGAFSFTSPAVELATATSDDAPVVSHACARLDNGDIYCWGSNKYGQLGNGTTNLIDNPTPTKVIGLPAAAIGLVAGGIFNCALLSNHETYCWGSNSSTPVKINITTGAGATIQKLTSNQNSMYSVASDGVVKTWGGTNFSSAAPTAVTIDATTYSRSYATSGHECQINLNGKMSCRLLNNYGNLSSGQLGIGDFGLPSVMTEVVGLTNVIAIETFSGSQTCAALSDQSIYCWGNNYFYNNIGSPTLFTGDKAPYPHKVLGVSGTKVTALPIVSSVSPYCTIQPADNSFICWGQQKPTPFYSTAYLYGAKIEANTPSQNINSGQCVSTTFNYLVGGATITAQDGFKIQLSIPSGVGNLYADSSCSQAITSVIFPAGESSYTLYYKGSWAGDDNKIIYIHATPENLGIAGAKIAYQFPAAKAQYISGQASYSAGGCTPNKASLYEATGLKVPAATDVTISVSAGDGLSVYSDSTCTTPLTSLTIAAGATEAVYYLSSIACDRYALILKTSDLRQNSFGYLEQEDCGCD